MVNDGQEPWSISYIKKSWMEGLTLCQVPFDFHDKIRSSAIQNPFYTHARSCQRFSAQTRKPSARIVKKSNMIGWTMDLFPRSLLGLPSQWNHCLQFLKCQGETWRSAEIRVGSCSVDAGSLWERKFLSERFLTVFARHAWHLRQS